MKTLECIETYLWLVEPDLGVVARAWVVEVHHFKIAIDVDDAKTLRSLVV